MIFSLPLEEPKEIMGVWQHLSGENIKQIYKIIEKHKSMINRLKSLELAKKMFGRASLEYYGR